MGINIEEIITVSIISIIIISILGAIVSAIFKPTYPDLNATPFFIVFIIITAIGSIMVDNYINVGIYGLITGLIVGLIENHILALSWGADARGLEIFMGNPTLMLIVTGIVVAIVANTIFGSLDSS